MKPANSISDSFYSAVFLRNARQEIDLALSELARKQASSHEVRVRLSEAMSLISKAWHVRNMTQQEFERLSDDEINWIRHAVPDLPIGSTGFRVVPADAKLGDR